MSVKKLLAIAIQKEKRLDSVIDLIARSEYEQVVSEITNYKEDIEIKNSTIKSLKISKQELVENKTLTKKEYKNKLLSELSVKQKEAHDIKAQIDTIGHL
jgi:hypothetical protein